MTINYILIEIYFFQTTRNTLTVGANIQYIKKSTHFKENWECDLYFIYLKENLLSLSSFHLATFFVFVLSVDCLIYFRWDQIIGWLKLESIQISRIKAVNNVASDLFDYFVSIKTEERLYAAI